MNVEELRLELAEHELTLKNSQDTWESTQLEIHLNMCEEFYDAGNYTLAEMALKTIREFSKKVKGLK
jgi:hypothetical protein